MDANERTDFVYDGGKVAEEIDYDATNQATYTHAGSSIYSPLLAQRVRVIDWPPVWQSHWFLQDALGSTLGLLSDTESLTYRLLYDAWGNRLFEFGSAPGTPYRYVGAYGCYRDTESDLLYLWMRYYDRAVGRFVRRDPGSRSRALVEQSLPNRGRYAYANNVPTVNGDPYGLWALRAGGGGLIGAGSGFPLFGGAVSVAVYKVIDSKAREGYCVTVMYAPWVAGTGAGVTGQIGASATDLPGLQGPGVEVGIEVGEPTVGASLDATLPCHGRSKGYPGFMVEGGPGLSLIAWGGVTYTWCVWVGNLAWWEQLLIGHHFWWVLVERLIRGKPIGFGDKEYAW